jgi:hypothetical protein
MRSRLRPAVEAALVAAIVSSAPGIAWVLAGNEPWWRPVQLIATLVGIDRLGAFDGLSFVVGGLLHLALSVGFAIVFAFVVGTPVVARATVLGALYGCCIFAVDFGASALLGLAGQLRAGTNDAVELAAHVSYGASMAWWLTRTRARSGLADEPAIERPAHELGA